MKKLIGFLFALVCAHGVLAAEPGPYDESANADHDIAVALKQAAVENKKVLVVFGANWCKDCRELDKALHGKTKPLVDQHYVTVKVDVGNFNKNMSLSEKYGNPTKKGIPAAVVLGADEAVLYATKGGELADARQMGDTGIYDFFEKMSAR